MCKTGYIGAACSFTASGPHLSTAGLYSIVTIVGSLLVVFAASAFALHKSQQKRRVASLLRLRATGQVPDLPFGKEHRWHCFLSHKWPTGQEPCASIRRQLLEKFKGIRVFLDVFDLVDASQLEEYVGSSSTVLIFLSRGYFSRRYCASALLRYSSTALLLYSSTALLLYCSTALLRYSSTPLLRYSSTPLLLYCSTALLEALVLLQ